MPIKNNLIKTKRDNFFVFLQINDNCFFDKNINLKKDMTMKKSSLILMTLLVFVFAFVACQKENVKPTNENVQTNDESSQTEDPDPVSPLAVFTGHYELEISVVGYFVDDEEAESQHESYAGTLDIGEPQVVNGVEQVTVKGAFNFSGGEVAQVYNTTGTLDNQGRLVLAKNNFTTVSGAVLEVSYGTMTPTNPLNFTSTLSCNLMGYDLRYEFSNTAFKQE